MAENFESENSETDEDFEENRSVFRYFKNLKQIFEKYSDETQVSDVVDMETLELITDNGDIAYMQEPTRFGYSQLAITKKDSAGRFDEREYEEFLRDPDSFLSPPNLPADPLKVKTEFPEAFNKTYVVNSLKQHSARLPKGVEEDALCKLEETLIEIIDSTSSDESSDYLSDESSSSSSSSGDNFLYKEKPSSVKFGDQRNNPSDQNVQSGKWNTLIRSPWKTKDKGSQSHGQKSPGIFKSTRSRSARKLSRIPADHRQCEKRLTLTPNIPDKFRFENHFECDDEKENLLGKELRGGQPAYSMSTTESSHGESSDTSDLNIKSQNRFQAPERQTQQRPKNPKHPAGLNAAKRRITPSLVRPLSDHHTPPKVAPMSRTDCFVSNPESPSVSMTRSLNCLTLGNHNNIHRQSDKPLDLSKSAASWNIQNPHTASSEKSKPRVDGKKGLEPKRLKDRFTGGHSAPQERVLLLAEGSSEDMEDMSDTSSSDDDASSTKSPLALSPSETPNEIVKKSIDDHPFLKPMITETQYDRPPMAKLARTVIPSTRDAERGACVKPKVGVSPRGRPHVQQNLNPRSPFTSPVAFFKVMQKKIKESPVLKPTAVQKVYSSNDNSSDAKQSVVRNDHRESPKQSIARADIQGSPADYQKKHKSSTTVHKMHSSGDGSSKTNQSLGRMDHKESPTAYQKRLKPGTSAQKMLYSLAENASEVKQVRGRLDYRASPKHSVDRTCLQGSPIESQIKLKPSTVAENMLYSSGDNSSDAMHSTGRNEYRGSTKQSLARADIQGSPAGHQKRPKPITVEQKMLYSSDDSGGEAKQSQGRNDRQESPAVYQKQLKSSKVAQKMYSSGENASEAKQARGRHDYRASPKHSIDRTDLQGSPAEYQIKLKPSTVAEKMLYSSGDNSSDIMYSTGRNEYRGSTKQLLARADIQRSPAGHQKKPKPSTVEQKMYSLGDSASEAKQSRGRPEYQASPKHSKECQMKQKSSTVAEKMLYSSEDNSSDAVHSAGRNEYQGSTKQLIASAGIQRSPAAYRKKALPNVGAQEMLYSSGDSGSEAKQSRDRRGYRASPKQSIARGDLQGSPAAHQKKLKPNAFVQKILYSSGDSSTEAKKSRDTNNYRESPKHLLVTEPPESTPNRGLSSRNEVTPPYADPRLVQATKVATTSTPTKGHNMAQMALDISCIPIAIPTLTEGPSNNKVTSRGDNGQRGVHTIKQGQGNSPLASCENIPENLCSVRQKDVPVKGAREGLIDHRLSSPLIEVPGFRRVEPMEDSSTSKLGTDDTMEHDLRSTSDSDSDNETFTVLSPQPKISAHTFSLIHPPKGRQEKKRPTSTLRQTYQSPLQKQVSQKAVQREQQKMASSARRASPAGGKHRSHTPKRWTYDDSESDSEHSGSDTASASRSTPRSERPVNDRLIDSRDPTKLTLSEPRRFFPNKKLTPSPRRFKEKSKSAVKNPRASKQLYNTTSSKLATHSPSAQKNLSQQPQASWNWSFNKKKQVDPYAQQLDMYELDTESCDSDTDEPINRPRKSVSVHRKSKTGTKSMDIFSPRPLESKASYGKAGLSSHENGSRIVDSSSDEQSDDTRPLLESRGVSGMSNSSLCLGPGKCDKTFCFTCV